MKQKRMTGRASALVAVFVITGILVLVLGARQVYRLTTSPAWVASSDLEAGHVITAESLKRARSGDDGGIENPRALLGKQLEVDKEKGDVFRPADLTTAPKSWLSAKVPEGRVLYTLTPKQTAIPHSQIRYGDRLDILARGRGGVRTVASDVLLMGALAQNNGAPTSARGRGMLTALAAQPGSKSSGENQGIPLVLAVRPGDIYPLAGIGQREEISIVLHGEAELAAGELLKIAPSATHRQIEVVSGLERTKKVVRN